MQHEKHMEQFSLAYIHAVAARAGFFFNRRDDDFASIDCFVSSDTGLFPEIYIQAKSTSSEVGNDDPIKFDLKVKNHNDLCIDDRKAKVLVLVPLPSEVADWTKLSEEEICLRCCGYWQSFRGRDPSDRDYTVRVDIPRGNRFDAQSLPSLMKRVEKGEL